MDDIKLALLGNRDAAKRLTDAGVLIPCAGCGCEEIVVSRGSLISIRTIGSYWCSCMDCGMQTEIKVTEREARLAWNTRAAAREET